MLTLTVPQPAIRYRVSVTVYRYIGQVSLRLIATPLRRKPSLPRLLPPKQWAKALSHSKPRRLRLELERGGQPYHLDAEPSRFATFSWYVSGFPTDLGPAKLVATKRVRIR